MPIETNEVSFPNIDRLFQKEGLSINLILTCISKVSMLRSYALRFKLWNTPARVKCLPSR